MAALFGLARLNLRLSPAGGARLGHRIERKLSPGSNWSHRSRRAEVAVKRIQTYTSPGITVTFDPELCEHSAVCLQTLPAVFDVRRARWVRPEAAPIADVTDAIGRCPSGALRYALGDPPARDSEES